MQRQASIIHDQSLKHPPASQSIAVALSEADQVTLFRNFVDHFNLIRHRYWTAISTEVTRQTHIRHCPLQRLVSRQERCWRQIFAQRGSGGNETQISMVMREYIDLVEEDREPKAPADRALQKLMRRQRDRRASPHKGSTHDGSSEDEDITDSDGPIETDKPEETQRLASLTTRSRRGSGRGCFQRVGSLSVARSSRAMRQLRQDNISRLIDVLERTASNNTINDEVLRG